MHLQMYAEDDVEAGIQHYLEENPCDLLAMVTHGRTGYSRLLNGSIVENLSKLVQIPLLAFRAGA